jgi:hypothetical protein
MECGQSGKMPKWTPVGQIKTLCVLLTYSLSRILHLNMRPVISLDE